MRILILHGIESPATARRTSINHTFFLPKYAPQHEYVFQGVKQAIPNSVRNGSFDVILIDTTFLCWRWAKPRPEGFDHVLDRFAFVARSNAIKIAFPQDDYDHCAYLDDWLTDWKIDIVSTPYSRFSEILLPQTSAASTIQFSLTGYLDNADLVLAERIGRPFHERSIDVGYRARNLPAFFGSLGRLKSDIATRFSAQAAGRGLKLDISTQESDSLNGDAWLQFLGDCRFTLATPSGSSVADPVGDIRAKVAEYVTVHSTASFDEIERACFPGLDGIHEYDTVSPRVFEAALANTCQILLEGHYVPGMKPGEHYIQINRDFSNFEDVLANMQNEAETLRRIRSTRELFLKDEALSYRGLTRTVLGWIADKLAERGSPHDRHALTSISSDGVLERHDEVLDRLRKAPESEDHPAQPAPMSVCLLSLSRIPDDPRVRRQGDALFGAGWSVVAIGQPGARSKRPVWPCFDSSHPAPIDVAVVSSTASGSNADAGPVPGVAADETRIGTTVGVAEPRQRSAGEELIRAIARKTLSPTVRAAARRGLLHVMSRAVLGLRILKARMSPNIALDMYWSWSSIQEIYDASRGVTADLWVANDWLMLPLAARLARERGGVFVYDTHEFAVNEYMERLKWRLFNRPIVKAIEATYIRQAKVVSTVSQGIADGLQRVYRLPTRPMLIRNTPLYQSVQPAPETDPIRVLYHGIVAPVRGLEPLIRSVKHLRPDFEVTIRGPGNDEYLQRLRDLIASEGVADRVTLAPPVPMTALVQEAAAFDVGFFCMPLLSQQHEYVLPNKLFEYIMAGLAICVSDLPEMSRIVKATGVGVLLPSAEPADIAKVVNGLTRVSIRAYKARSLEVARELCWEQESKALLEAYAGAVGRA